VTRACYVTIYLTRSDAEDMLGWLDQLEAAAPIAGSTRGLGFVLQQVLRHGAVPTQSNTRYDYTRLRKQLLRFASRKRLCDVNPLARHIRPIAIVMHRSDVSWLAKVARQRKWEGGMQQYFSQAEAMDRACALFSHASNKGRGRPRLAGHTLDAALLRKADDRHKKRLRARKRREASTRRLGDILAAAVQNLP
jgi:hypothetical protein